MPRIAALAAATLLLAAQPATADPEGSGDAAAFMTRFSGEWRGTGRVLVGPAHGTKFHCALAGDRSGSDTSFLMTGRCWLGRLSAPVTARMRYNAETGRYYGAFRDGGDGSGLDIVGAREGEGFVLSLTRGMAHGRLTAEPVGRTQMKVMISLVDRPNDREIPVIAMGLAKDGAASLPHYYEPGATGSVAKTQ
ncbi:MAG TPA: hypothetical protein VHG92_02610 [Afifellaceae bacterium]|nr:hypothetical protein [Afifellaceae bacterium]